MLRRIDSTCGPQAPELKGLKPRGRWDLSFPVGDRSLVHCSTRWILHHWTPRAVLCSLPVGLELLGVGFGAERTRLALGTAEGWSFILQGLGGVLAWQSWGTLFLGGGSSRRASLWGQVGTPPMTSIPVAHLGGLAPRMQSAALGVLSALAPACLQALDADHA